MHFHYLHLHIPLRSVGLCELLCVPAVLHSVRHKPEVNDGIAALFLLGCRWLHTERRSVWGSFCSEGIIATPRNFKSFVSRWLCDMYVRISCSLSRCFTVDHTVTMCAKSCLECPEPAEHLTPSVGKSSNVHSGKDKHLPAAQTMLSKFKRCCQNWYWSWLYFYNNFC